MEVDPLSILFTLIRISAVILLIILFMSLWSAFGMQAKNNDLERFNVELFENIATSQLTFGKYIFDPDKLNDAALKDENFLSFVRDCKYKYKFEIEDLKTGNKWTFGEDTNSAMSKLSQYDYRNTREYYAGIVRKNAEKNAPFYEDAGTAKVTVTVTDTITGRLACAIEKAYKSKTIETLQIKGCLEISDCITFKRNSNKACFYREKSTPPENYIDCKILPIGPNGGADFIAIQKSIKDIPGQDTETKPLLLTAYPLKTGVIADCDTIKNNPADFEPGQNENTGIVQICVTSLTVK